MSADARRSTFLAFDLGASSGRAILGWIDDGRIQIEELHRFPTPLVQEGDRLYWDVDALWEELRTGLAKARARDGLLRSLSVDSWGVDYVPLDADGVPVRRAASYRDPRAVGMLARATERVSKEEIYRTTGIQFMEINTLYQVLADALLDPDVYARTHSRLLIADYFNTRFSGIARAERSLASTTQLMHASEVRWATEMMDALGIGGGEWPPIMDSGTRLGPAREAPEVTVLAGCSHDTACAVAAVPALPDTSDWAYLSCGTWSLLGVELSAPLLTDAAREAGFTNEAGIDGTTRFLKNMTGLWILQ
ncbi:MAG TPA: FGGY family carbohydrate kinase, partial [Rhodothermales bacterium]